ncbi:unnamed protein product [Albugo candida]|uniref:OBG-type G domain-containing protein n=1 Tax=Albugo candida TaxID=65357 RepID=A0A024GKS1_9STRA|nr:unnamed protein product [Albugo candida]|eukprot:CCI47363.1 unnamed protein product [Albugo candida]
MEINQMRFWKASVHEKRHIVDPIKRAKNQVARLINYNLQKLSAATRKTSLAFPALSRMHAFEREVVRLTLGDKVYEQKLQMLRKVYAICHNIAKSSEKNLLNATTKQEAIDVGFLCIEKMKTTIKEQQENLEEVAVMTKTLRALPTFNLDESGFAFVGAPNVGKSSLVRALSTASPEVANYPFTTRGITMGHIFVDGIPRQIVDTPGLLYRPDIKRNVIEKLSLAIIEKTKVSIGFVIDPSGHSGNCVGNQLLLRDEIQTKVRTMREKGSYQWIDVISKSDLATTDQVEQILARTGNDNVNFSVSTETNRHLSELGAEIRKALCNL